MFGVHGTFDANLFPCRSIVHSCELDVNFGIIITELKYQASRNGKRVHDGVVQVENFGTQSQWLNNFTVDYPPPLYDNVPNNHTNNFLSLNVEIVYC